MIPIADPAIPDAAADAAAAVIRSGHLRQGERVEAFEYDFARYIGIDYAIAVSSGTAALHVAYHCLLGNGGGEVLVPALSHISTASMVVQAGGTPVFCDVDPETGIIDPDDAEARITDDTVAIAPVHLYGRGAPMWRINDIADRHRLAVIGDAAQAIGTMHDGSDVATWADITTYSFYPTKHVTTGEGGMLVTNDDELAQRARLFRAHGQTEKYLHPTLGVNYRLTDIGAAIGIEHLKTLPERIVKRQRNARVFNDALHGDPSSVWGHTYHQFTIRCADREAARATFDDHGIETAVHYPRPLHRQPAFDTDASLPVAERLCEEVLSIPVHERLSEADREQIVTALRQVAVQ